MRLILCSSPLLLALGCAATAQNTKPTMHDAAALASLESYVRTGMDEVAKGNIAWWKQTACPEAVMWDVDPEGNALTAVGKVQIDATLDGFQKMMSSGGAQMTTNTTSIQCRATSLSGHCLVDFDQSVTQGGKTLGPFKFRGTAIADRHGDGWLWTHWHASMREAPAAPAAAPAPAPAAPTPSPSPSAAPAPTPGAAPAPTPSAAPAPTPGAAPTPSAAPAPPPAAAPAPPAPPAAPAPRR